MNAILRSIVPVIQQAKYVKINHFRLDDFCSRFEGLYQSFKIPFIPFSLNIDDKIQLDFAYNSANFCYWGDPKWAITHQGREISGAYGMKAAFNRALEERFPLLDASYLENLTEMDLAHIVRGNTTIPLFQERLLFLRQLGRILNEKYHGKSKNVVDAGEGDSLRLLEEVTSNFPCYDDSAEYNGNKVLFHKRAQLFVHNVHKALEKEGKILSSIDELSALADYKIPQLLRNRGIFEYGPELANRVDNYQIIPAGGVEEVEIRAFTLEAVELMVEKLKPGFPSLNAINLDSYLYLEAKKKYPEDKPHHRALTTAH